MVAWSQGGWCVCVCGGGFQAPCLPSPPCPAPHVHCVPGGAPLGQRIVQTKVCGLWAFLCASWERDCGLAELAESNGLDLGKAGCQWAGDPSHSPLLCHLGWVSCGSTGMGPIGIKAGHRFCLLFLLSLGMRLLTQEVGRALNVWRALRRGL